MFLTPTDYGITGLITSFTSLVSVLFTLALGGAVRRFYYDYKEDENKLRKFWGTIIVFISINSAILSILIMLFRDFLISPFIKGVAFYPFIFIGILNVIVTPVYTIFQSILQTKQEARNYSINSIFHFGVMAFLNITFVVVFKLGVIGVLLASLLTGIIFAIYSILNLMQRKLITITFHKEYFAEALKYSLPIVPHSMSGVIASFTSRLFLNNDISTAYLGLFNVGAQFLILLDTLQVSVNNAYVPWFYGIMSQGKSEHKKVINFADFLLRANCMLSLAISLFIKEVIQIMTNPTYLIAWVIVPIMIIAYQIRGVYLFYVNTLFYNKGATKFIFLATFSGNIVSIILSALLTKRIGIITPALVFLVEKIVTTIIITILSRRIEPVDFKLGRMILYIFILVIGSVIGLAFDLQNPTGSINILNILYKLTLLLLVSIAFMNSDLKIILNNLKQQYIKRIGHNS